MEPNTKSENNRFPYAVKDFLPLTVVFAITASVAVLFPQGFFDLGRMEFAAWVGCVCAMYQILCAGPSRFEVVEDAVVRYLTYSAMVLGAILLFDGMIFPKGAMLPVGYSLKSILVTVMPFAFLLVWGIESVFVSRKMRSKAKLQKALDEVREYAKRVSEEADGHLKGLKGQS